MYVPAKTGVVLALDFDLDLKRLVVVLQCLRILALFVKDRADTAQQRQSHGKGTGRKCKSYKALTCCRSWPHAGPLMADTFYNIGNTYVLQGLFESAAENFERCAVIYSKVHGDNHSDTIDACTCAKSARTSIPEG